MKMTGLFQRLLGSAFDELPEPVRRFHTLDREIFTSGSSTITAPRKFGARLLALVAGLPSPGRDTPTTVHFTPLANAREFWRRDFAARRYQSVMEASPNGQLIEHFGPFDLYFELSVRSSGLHWSLKSWRLLGVPLPSITTPKIECLETASGDAFAFDIDVMFPIIGPVVHYNGELSEIPIERSALSRVEFPQSISGDTALREKGAPL
jgi:hypothetical protein